LNTDGSDSDRPRLLPARPRPKAGETTDSYIRRLSRANHLKPSYLRGYLAGPPNWLGRPRAERLAALTGRQQTALEQALVDLLPPARTKVVKCTTPQETTTRRTDRSALFTAIRQDARTEGLSIRALAERHHVSRRTIGHALDSPTPPTRKSPPARERPALDRARPIIDAMLDNHAEANDGQPLTTRFIWEHLLDQHDSEVSYATVRDYIAQLRQQTPEDVAFPVRERKRRSGNILSTSVGTTQGPVIQHYRELLAAVGQRPSAHGLDGTYASMTAFVLGCDAGSSNGMLAGFREWLIVRLDHGNNLAWPALVRHLAPNGFVHPLTPEADTAAVGALFQLLNEFLELREGRDGPLKIYGAYQAWLNAQNWYHPDPSPTDQIN
jgi:hypothetical protein